LSGFDSTLRVICGSKAEQRAKPGEVEAGWNVMAVLGEGALTARLGRRL
jgi:hypothetical protein